MTVALAKKTKVEYWEAIDGYTFENLVPPTLWDRVVETFGGECAATRAFASKLCTKKGWDLDFALGAIQEYKRFVYLGMVTSFPVTPSKYIDDVWHQHIQFTRAYREFCDNVLGRTFDHNPELVALSEQTEQFQDQYYATLCAYREEFGMEPPSEFWSKPKFKVKERKVYRSGRLMQLQDSDRNDRGELIGGLAEALEDLPLHLLWSQSTHKVPLNITYSAETDGDSNGGGVFKAIGNVISNVGEAVSDAADAVGDAVGGDGGGGDGGGSSCSSGCGGGCGGD